MADVKSKSPGRSEQASFVVDTQLFRELGELLVGSDATALLELVKNSYDADATVVTVYGQRLDSKSRGQILVIDDGDGMNLKQFRAGFLRLAGRSKTLGKRRSVRFGRRYTGEKGVGRLATHKLARLIEVESVPFSKEGRPRGVRATVDWSRIEKLKTVEQAGKAVDLQTFTPPNGRSSGTQIRLARLRHTWDSKDLTDFIASAEVFGPPRPLIDSERLRKRLDPPKLLFKTPRVRDMSGGETDPGFDIHLTGDFAISDDHWDEMVESVEWVLEIDARRSGVRFCASPTEREMTVTKGHARRHEFKVRHPEPKVGPFFQARIFVRARNVGPDIFRAWSKDVAGVRVYSEGFRVLPYGAPDNDWLEINRTYAARKGALELLEANQLLEEEIGDADEDDTGLTLLPSDSYLGAVFLTRERSGQLEALVNREGFVPNRAFYNLRDLTGLGITLLTRARAAGRLEKREAAKAARERRRRQPSEAADAPPPAESWRREVDQRIKTAVQEVGEMRVAASSGKLARFEQDLARLEGELESLSAAVGGLIAEQRLTPVLASVGIQMGEFIHEINGLLAMAVTMDTALGRLRENPENFTTPSVRRAVGEAQQSARDLRARLERQATYLIDLTSPAAVRRRSRQRIAERIDRAAELVAPALDRRSITFDNQVPSGVRTPPMFPAEITAVLLNLLTNAVKAAGEGGRIRAATQGKGNKIRLENTGSAVDLGIAERWFRPFETTTTEVDPLLGQGMGFGLPITRGILEEYGAKVRFVKPRAGYATAIQVEFPS
ncbi:MAG TPA: ATP-binding protein [Solirubrobacterales bacterium]|nr:ATP-binding protein [Solirubrobacterales bacterium]